MTDDLLDNKVYQLLYNVKTKTISFITAGRTDNNEQDRPYPLYSTQFNLI